MALRWIDGFEGARNINIFARLYAVATGSIASETGYRDTGLNAISSANLLLTSVDLLGGAADQNTWVVGLALRLNTNAGLDSGATTFPYVSLKSAAGEQLRFELIPANDSKPGGNYYKIRVRRGATTLATSTDRINASNSDLNWAYLEFKATIRTGTNGSFSLVYHRARTKNITVAWDSANTGVNTANQGADGADRFEISLTEASVATNIAIDNLYVLDSSGSLHTDRLGEVEIEALDVNGNGATDAWALNGGATTVQDAWDETAITQSTTEDNKRVTSSNVGDVELAALGNPASLRFVQILAIQTNVYAKMEASGSRTIQFWYRKTTGTPAEAGTASVTLSSTAIVGAGDCLETDPNTSAAWVLADVDGLQAGVKLTA